MSRRLGFNEQLAYEAEGAQAGLNGKTREDCPYRETDNPSEWNHWVFGCEQAIGEMATIRSGRVEFMNELGQHLFHLPVAEAIKTGAWRPRWATLERTAKP